jgi:hypothetical protein
MIARKILAVLLGLTLSCAATEQPRVVVEQYYELARSGSFADANKLLASHEWKKIKRFHENETTFLERIRKYQIKPKFIDNLIQGRFAMVAVSYTDPDSPTKRERATLNLLVLEEEQWRMLVASRPYLPQDSKEWNASPKDLQDVRDLEKWYMGLNKNHAKTIK